MLVEISQNAFHGSYQEGQWTQNCYHLFSLNCIPTQCYMKENANEISSKVGNGKWKINFKAVIGHKPRHLPSQSRNLNEIVKNSQTLKWFELGLFFFLVNKKLALINENAPFLQNKCNYAKTFLFLLKVL